MTDSYFMDILNQFGINPILLAAQVVNFFILLWILKRFLYRPILKVLAERRKKIEDSLKNAEEIEQKLLQTEEDRERILAKATEEAQKLVLETKKEIALMKEEGKHQVEQQTALIMKKTEEALRVEKERMLGEARLEITDLVIALFSKVTGKVITKEDEKKIIEREVRNLS